MKKLATLAAILLAGAGLCVGALAQDSLDVRLRPSLGAIERGDIAQAREDPVVHEGVLPVHVAQRRDFESAAEALLGHPGAPRPAEN